MRDAAGRITGLLGASQDVTATRLAMQQLREAQKMEAIGRLTGGIAHDFNNILGVMMGNLELLQRQLPLDPSSGEAMRRATAAVDHGAKLTRRLLAFARQQSLEPTLVNIVAVVRRRRGMLDPLRSPDTALGGAHRCGAAGGGADQFGRQRARRDA
jgi:signal transduction histidine kinase